MNRAVRFCRRIRFFLAIVWRPVTGPTGGEEPMSDFQVWWHYRLPITAAWQISAPPKGSPWR